MRTWPGFLVRMGAKRPEYTESLLPPMGDLPRQTRCRAGSLAINIVLRVKLDQINCLELTAAAQRLDDAQGRLDRAQRHRLTVVAERLASRAGALRPSLLERRLDRDRARLEGLERLFASLDPRALLSRGYAMVRDGEGAIVTTAAKARDAGHLRLQFADGDVAVKNALIFGSSLTFLINVNH